VRPARLTYIMPIPDPPSLTQQILWLRDRATDAEELRQLLVSSGHVNAARLERDAAMWDAVLDTLQAIARADGAGSRPAAPSIKLTLN
jgi:hypothetical protein